MDAIGNHHTDIPIRLFGLIGKKLDHSFSPSYFTEKFKNEGIFDAAYRPFAVSKIEDFPELLIQYPNLKGLNVTIPYKESIIPYLQELSASAQAVGAVNTLEFLPNGRLRGHNTDIDGFLATLLLLPTAHLHLTNALVLGTGGASKAVCHVLKGLKINYKTVSRTPTQGQLGYTDLDKNTIGQHLLIINTTPLGMYPEIAEAPPIPYHYLNSEHLLIDLIYNPTETLFLSNGKKYGAFTQNGLYMLKQQAEKAWKIWTEG